MADGVKVFDYISQVIKMNATEKKKSYRFLKSAIESAEIKFDVITPGKVQKILDKAGDDFDRFKRQKIAVWKCREKSAEINFVPINVLSAELAIRSLVSRKLTIQNEITITPEEFEMAFMNKIMEEAKEEAAESENRLSEER